MAHKKRHHHRRGAPKPPRTYSVSAFGLYGVGGYYGGYPGWGDSGTAQSPLNGDQFGGVGGMDGGADMGGTGGDAGGGTV